MKIIPGQLYQIIPYGKREGEIEEKFFGDSFLLDELSLYNVDYAGPLLAVRQSSLEEINLSSPNGDQDIYFKFYLPPIELAGKKRRFVIFNTQVIEPFNK